MENANSPGPNRFWAGLRILQVRLRFILLMAIVGLIAGNWENIMNHMDRWRRPAGGAAGAQAQEHEYFCPMHPNIIRADPGQCPICGMPLVKRAKSGAGGQLPPGVLAQVQLTPQKVEMGRIGTSTAEYRLLGREIRTVGTADYDETRRANISARIKGRIEKLMINFVGQQVNKGDPLALIYSPDLLVTQQELLLAVRNLKDQQGRPGEEAARQMLESARKRLHLWGITPAQVEEIIAKGQPQTELTIYSPIAGIVTEKNVLEGGYVNEGDKIYTIADLSRIWLQAQVFEDEIKGVEAGTAVEVRSAAYPSEIFAGRISFISFAVDPSMRTVAARVEVANPEYKLKPGMNVDAIIHVPVGRVLDPNAPAEKTAQGAPTAPPAPAAQPKVDTGPLARAYLALLDVFAHDKTDPGLAQKLEQEAQALKGKLDPSAVRDLEGIIESIKGLAGKGLAAQRKLLAILSSELIDFVQAHPPADLTLYITHCPMVEADWLQTKKGIENPYYGSEMFACGEITGTIKPAGASADQERFAVGYYCPIYPDRLFADVRDCPVDNFPFKLRKREKVLAVPETALINTGTRMIAYVQSAPGIFDMTEVKVDKRAGDFYPVLEGLQAGAEVATRGTFLIDAENRLNPAASSQYFGASGGPSAAH